MDNSEHNGNGPVDKINDSVEENGEPESNGMRATHLPSSTEVDESELEALRGDAIGSTAYSERFVLSTLLALGKLTEKQTVEDENTDSDESKTELDRDLEESLETLWDMTMQEDVVKLLLSHDVIEIFTNIISIVKNWRLIEILVGIIGNMTLVEETRLYLKANMHLTRSLLALVDCWDPPTLVELMRLIRNCMHFCRESDSEWAELILSLPDLPTSLGNIANNSLNEDLVCGTFDAIHSIVTTFSIKEWIDEYSDADDSGELTFVRLYGRTELINGVISGIYNMIERFKSEDRDDWLESPTKSERKYIIKSLEIHHILSDFGDKSLEFYQPLMGELIQYLIKICSHVTVKLNLYATDEYLELITNVFDIIGNLNNQFNEEFFKLILEIIFTVNEFKCDLSANGQWNEDNLQDDSRIDEIHENLQISNELFLDYISTSSEYLTESSLQRVLQQIKNSKENIEQLFIDLIKHKGINYLRATDLVKLAAKELWQLELNTGQM